MAVNTTKTHLFDGDRKNRKQGIRIIPAKAEANKPGILGLQSVDAGTVTDRYLFFRDGGLLAYSTTIPGTSASHGTLVGTAGADTALSNLASVQIPDAGDLIPENDNEVSLGVAGTGFSTLHLSTSLVFNETTNDLTILCTDQSAAARNATIPNLAAHDTFCMLAESQALTTKTYDGLTIATATTNAMTLTRGTASIALAEGDTDLALGAGAQVAFVGTADFDQATGTTVDINYDLTVSGAADIDQDLSASGAPTWTSLVTCQGIVNTTTAIDTTAAINIGADSTKITFGVSDASDSYIEFDGSTMILYDTTTGPWTLAELATGTTLNPTVTGNLTIGDGNFTWTNAANNESAVWTLAATATDGIQIASSNTSADVIQITANATAAGNLLHLIAVDATMTSGAYIYGHDGTAQAFAFRRYGALTIAGNASGADALTLTAGDITVTDGDLTLTTGELVFTNGYFTQDSTQAVSSYCKRNNSGSSTPVFIVENTHQTGTGYAAQIIQAAGASSAGGLTISNEGTSPILHLAAGASRTGYGIHIPMANQLAEQAILINGASTGASDEGVLEVASTGVLAAGANLLRLNSSGANEQASFVAEIICSGGVVDSTLGTCLNMTDTGNTAGTSYAMYVNSTNNNAMNIVTGSVGKSNLVMTGLTLQTASMAVLDGSTGAGWLGGASAGMLHLNAIGDRTNAASSLLRISDVTGASPAAGRGTSFAITDTTTVGADSFVAYISTTANDGLKIDTGHAAGINLELQGVTDQAAPMLYLDGTTTNGWDGDDGVGMVQLTSKGAHAHANASMLNIVASTGTSIANARGTHLRMIDTTAAGSDAWIAYMDTTNNDGLLINTGAVSDVNLKLTGISAQISSMMVIDGTTDAGWDGAADTGQLHIVNDGAQIDEAASALYIDLTAAPIAAAEGAAIHVIQSGGSAVTDGYMVNIEAKAGGGGLHVDGGFSTFDEKVTFVAGQQSSAVAVTSSATKASAAIPPGSTFVTVTSGTATHYVELPEGSISVGNVIWINVAGTGYELITEDSTTEYLNGGISLDADDAASSVGANVLVRAVCIDATHWLASQFDTAGEITALENATCT